LNRLGARLSKSERPNSPLHLTSPRGAIVDARVPQVSGNALGRLNVVQALHPRSQNESPKALHTAECRDRDRRGRIWLGGVRSHSVSFEPSLSTSSIRHVSDW